MTVTKYIEVYNTIIVDLKNPMPLTHMCGYNNKINIMMDTNLYLLFVSVEFVKYFNSCLMTWPQVKVVKSNCEGTLRGGKRRGEKGKIGEMRRDNEG